MGDTNKLIWQIDDNNIDVNISSRGKSRIKISINNGQIFVSHPNGTSKKSIIKLLDSKKDWAIRNLSKHQLWKIEQKENLNLAGEEYILKRYSISKKKVYIDENIIHIFADKYEQKELIVKEVNKFAKRYLTQRIKYIAEALGFEYKKLSFRNQLTRWGSCSSQKNISLNLNLIFESSEFIDSTIIHELCHTIEMNHSKRFWDLFKNKMKEFQEFQKNTI